MLCPCTATATGMPTPSHACSPTFTTPDTHGRDTHTGTPAHARARSHMDARDPRPSVQCVWSFFVLFGPLFESIERYERASISRIFDFFLFHHLERYERASISRIFDFFLSVSWFH